MKIPKFRNEAALQSFCLSHAETLGIQGYAWKKANITGVPDTLFIFPGGLVIFIEFKHPNGRGKLSENQKERRDEIQSQGAPWYAVDSFEDFAAVVDFHVERRSALSD